MPSFVSARREEKKRPKASAVKTEETQFLENHPEFESAFKYLRGTYFTCPHKTVEGKGTPKLEGMFEHYRECSRCKDHLGSFVFREKRRKHIPRKRLSAGVRPPSLRCCGGCR